jgi:hypothetical protein
VEVGTHAGHITYIIGDNGRVAGVVFGYAGFDFTDKISAYVGRLGEYTAADTGKNDHHRETNIKDYHSLHSCCRWSHF